MLAMLAGCHAPAGNGAKDAPRGIVAETAESAPFRSAARQLYDSLDRPSCQAGRADIRAERLRSEQDAVAAFEKSMGDTPAAFQLRVARADSAYAIAAEHSCWDDSHPAFASSHLKTTQRDVEAGLKALAALAPGLGRAAIHAALPARSAEYRYQVRTLLATVQPLCEIARDAPNAAVLQPALEAVRGYRASLSGADYLHHYAIAEADVRLALSKIMTECAMPQGAAEKVREETLADVRAQIAALRQIRF